MTRHYYNEFDPFAAEWLRNLIAAGEIPAGDVDTRSIKEVQPDDLIGYTQCHFFAGIAGWGLAARIANFPEDRELWTGSCPCQPFSNAGQGGGTDDPRHLWPDFFRLIRARRPALVMGEQVASALGRAWFDGVASDLEGEDYACRAVDIPACAVDTPHIRSRLYWIARASGVGQADAGCFAGRAGPGQPGDGSERADVHGAVAMADAGREPRQQDAGSALGDEVAHGRAGRDRLRAEGDHGHLGHDAGAMAHPDGGGRAGWPEDPERGSERRAAAERADARGDACGQGQPPSEREDLCGEGGRHEGRATEQSDEAPAGGLADADLLNRRGAASRPEAGADAGIGGGDERGGSGALGHTDPVGRSEPSGDEREVGGWDRTPAPRDGFWSDHEWLVCHDGKARRTLAGLPLLVDGVSGRVALGDALPGRVSEDEAYHLISRVGAWRGFGNAIVPQLAAEVIGAFLDAEAEEQDFFA